MSERIRWSGFEFEHKERTADWFWAVGIIFVSIAAISFIYSNPLFGVFMLIAGVMLLTMARKVPRLIDYELSNKGLHIDDKIYHHSELHAFWVSQNKYSAPKLILRTNRWTNPMLIITIETDYIDADKVRDFLLDYVPEERIDEPLSVRFMEFLGF